MSSTLGGADPAHDLSAREKDIMEADLQQEARALMRQGKIKQRRRCIARANEISRRKAKRAHEHE